MSSQPPTDPKSATPVTSLSGGGGVDLDGWRFHELREVGSTNDAAAALPAWSAVRADRQSAGRGRHDRVWRSGVGGLWLSAVVPMGPLDQGWGALPLAAGLAVCQALATLGAGPLRLRWPNDVMVGRRKLAGLLVEQFRAGLAVVGVGLNVTNEPAFEDPDLAAHAVALGELLAEVPRLRPLSRVVLGELRGVVERMQETGFAGLVPRVNAWWEHGSNVEIETGEGRTNGVFLGVDAMGRLRVGNPGGAILELAAHQVIRMRELPGD